MIVFVLHLFLQLARSKLSVGVDKLSGHGQIIYREMEELVPEVAQVMAVFHDLGHGG
jgi:hypothetical protein